MKTDHSSSISATLLIEGEALRLAPCDPKTLEAWIERVQQFLTSPPSSYPEDGRDRDALLQQLAVALHAHARLDQAVHILLRYERGHPTAPAALALARVHDLEGRLELAVAWAERYRLRVLNARIRDSRMLIHAHLLCARAHCNTNNLSDAIHACHLALTTAHDHDHDPSVIHSLRCFHAFLRIASADFQFDLELESWSVLLGQQPTSALLAPALMGQRPLFSLCPLYGFPPTGIECTFSGGRKRTSTDSTPYDDPVPFLSD